MNYCIYIISWFKNEILDNNWNKYLILIKFLKKVYYGNQKKKKKKLNLLIFINVFLKKLILEITKLNIKSQTFNKFCYFVNQFFVDKI